MNGKLRLAWLATTFVAVLALTPALRAADEKPATDTPATEKSVENKPAENKPEEPKATETKPEAKPADNKPADTKPPEAKPEVLKPAEVKAPEAKPAESKPVETKAPEKAPETTSPKDDVKAAINEAKQDMAKLTGSAAATTQPAAVATPALAMPAATPVAAPAKPAAPTMNIMERAWYAQGLTHPIVVHFPIGLLMAAAFAAVVRIFYKKISSAIIYFCLFIGAGGAILSSLAGWAWAPQLESGWDPFAGQILVNPDLKLVGAGVAGVGLLSVLIGWLGVKKEPHRSTTLQLGWIVLVLGAAAAAAGQFALAQPDVPVLAIAEDGRSDYFIHRWGGITVTVATLLTFVLATFAIKKANAAQWPWQGAVVLLAAVTGWVGHEGGELVYPKNFDRMQQMVISGLDEEGQPLIDIKDKAVKRKKAPAVTVSIPAMKPDVVPNVVPTTNPVAIAVGDRIDFAKQVWPLFERSCIECHGEAKAKGDYRMHTAAALMKAGESERAPIVIGKPSDSPLFVHLTGGMIKLADGTTEELDIMPPKPKKALTTDEIEVVRKWIEQGATWNK